MDDNTFSGHPTSGFSEYQAGMRIGPYELLELLGQGGMGAVWKASDTEGNRGVALKVLPREFRGNKDAMAQVRSSFQLSHALTHQHLCKVLALVDDPQHGPFLVMEFVPGITLSEYSRRFPAGRVPLPQVMSILSRVAEALDYAHQKVFQTPDGERKGVLHRDVKPQNIMLCLKGDAITEVSLIDIGLAAEIRSTATRFTQARVDTRGTRPYMSPEQLSGKRSQWDGRSDQYSLGVVAYELLAGHPPFEGDDDAVLMHAIINVQPDPIDALPGPVNAVLAKVLAKKKEERFSCCLEFIRTLHNPGTATLNREEELAAERARQEKQEQERRAEQERLEREKASQQGPVKLQIIFYGDDSFGVNREDMIVIAPEPSRPSKVFFDGKQLQEIYLKRGFHLSVDTRTGDHELLIRWTMTMVNLQSDRSTRLPGEVKITLALERKGNATAIIGCPTERFLVLDSINYD